MNLASKCLRTCCCTSTYMYARTQGGVPSACKHVSAPIDQPGHDNCLYAPSYPNPHPHTQTHTHRGQSALEAIGDVIVLQAEQQHAQAVPDDSPSVDECVRALVFCSERKWGGETPTCSDPQPHILLHPTYTQLTLLLTGLAASSPTTSSRATRTSSATPSALITPA